MSKKPKIFVPQAVTGNDAATGLVVFRTGKGAWSHSLSDAQVALSDNSAEALLALAMADAADNVVVDPYLIDVAKDKGGVRALKFPRGNPRRGADRGLRPHRTHPRHRLTPEAPRPHHVPLRRIRPAFVEERTRASSATRSSAASPAS